MKNGKYGISDVAEMLGVSKSTVSRVIMVMQVLDRSCVRKLWILSKK